MQLRDYLRHVMTRRARGIPHYDEARRDYLTVLGAQYRAL